MEESDQKTQEKLSEAPSPDEPLIDRPLPQAYDLPEKPDPRRCLLLQYIGAVVWPSFLAACAGSFFFFAMFDPVSLGPITAWEIHLSREMGYTLGFLLFWALTAGCNAVTAWLIYGFHGNKPSP